MKNYVMFDEQFFFPCDPKSNKVSYHLYDDFGNLDEVYVSKKAVHDCMVKFFQSHKDISLVLDSYMLNSLNVYSIYARRRFMSQYYFDHPEEFGLIFDDENSLSQRIQFMNSHLPFPVRKLKMNHGI